MNKQDIKQWLEDKEGITHNSGSGDTNWLIDMMTECFNDLQGWVSVEENYPKENCSYIVNTLEDGVIDLEFYKCPEYGNFDWFCPVTKDEVGATVTHWRPMPLPPSEAITNDT